MNREQFKKNLYRHFRIQPAMQLYESNGVLRGSIDDAWVMMEITDNAFTLRNRATHYIIELGFDSFVNYVEDPAGKTQNQTDGVLVLKAQLYMHEGLLKFAQTVAPGKELRDFTPPTKREGFLDAARSNLDDSNLQTLRDEFDRQRLFPEVMRAFDEIGDVIDTFIVEAQAHGLDVQIKVHRYKGGYLMWACGWYVTITWQNRGLPRESYLSILKWRGRPNNVPGITHSFDNAEPVAEWKYRYGLAQIDEVGWIVPNAPDVALSTREVLERLLVLLHEKPNREMAPIWDLPRDSRPGRI